MGNKQIWSITPNSRCLQAQVQNMIGFLIDELACHTTRIWDHLGMCTCACSDARGTVLCVCVGVSVWLRSPLAVLIRPLCRWYVLITRRKFTRASIKSNIKSERENGEKTQRTARPPLPACASLKVQKLHNLNQPAISFKADAEVPHTQLAADDRAPL